MLEVEVDDDLEAIGIDGDDRLQRIALDRVVGSDETTNHRSVESREAEGVPVKRKRLFDRLVVDSAPNGVPTSLFAGLRLIRRRFGAPFVRSNRALRRGPRQLLHARVRHLDAARVAGVVFDRRVELFQRIGIPLLDQFDPFQVLAHRPEKGESR
jgi:hypothetical protein